MMNNSIDVVIPTYNEQVKIQAQVNRVLESRFVNNVIVVDGTSTDQTCKNIPQHPKVQTIQTKPSRGYQCDQGGKKATSDLILFLHADVELPSDWESLIFEKMKDPTAVGGAFQIQTVADPEMSSWADGLLFLANLRSRYTKRPYGDQCIFVRREIFNKVEGFPDQVLFEDLEFSKKLTKEGKIKIIKEKVKVSGRRMQNRPIFYFLMINVLPILYRLGVPAQYLSKAYLYKGIY